jgi:type II secretory pathway pseudopilin PulG
MSPVIKRKMNNRGWTIIELMMVCSIIGLVVPSLILVFQYCSEGLATAEIHLSLKQLNEQIMLHLHERMNQTKHMFQNNAASGGLSLIGQIQMGSAPASLSFSLMPQGQNGSTVTFSPAAGAVSSSFGDCLFYAAYDSPQTIGKDASGNADIFIAPVTVGASLSLTQDNWTKTTTSATAVTDSSGKAVTMNLDIYRFYFDYLSSAGDMKPIPGVISYWLIEWQSVQFVDAFELEDIGSTDGTLEKNVITWLCNGANFPNGQPLTLAWDPSQTSMVDAFYQLSAGNTIVQSSYIANQSILMQNWTVLSRMNSGLVNNFNYGISGNYHNLAGDPPPPNVPMYNPPTSTANAFPGGFEVGLEGYDAGMQVMIRSLLIAHGNNRGGVLWDNENTVSSARDVW